MYMPRKSLIGPDTYTNYINTSQYDDHLPNVGWDYPIEYQHIVHPHYRGFSAPPLIDRLFFHLVYTLLMFSSFFGNGLVLWIFSTSKNLRTPSNLLIINLAVFDIIMLMNIPHYLSNAVVGYMVGGELGCDIYAVIGGISGMGAAIMNAFIAYDRYRTISNPIDGRLSYTKIGCLIAFSWVYVVPFSVLPFFKIFGRYITEGFLTNCSYDYLSDDDETRYFGYTIFVYVFVIPMGIIVTYYAKLFTHVREHERMLAEQAKKMNVKSLSVNANTSAMSVELRIAKAALIIWMLYMLAWTPYATLALLSALGYRQMITPFVSMVPATICKTVSCLDPWVYAASHPKYRLELERRLPWLGIRERGGVVNKDGEAGSEADTHTVVVDN